MCCKPCLQQAPDATRGNSASRAKQAWPFSQALLAGEIGDTRGALFHVFLLGGSPGQIHELILLFLCINPHPFRGNSKNILFPQITENWKPLRVQNVRTHNTICLPPKSPKYFKSTTRGCHRAPRALWHWRSLLSPPTCPRPFGGKGGELQHKYEGKL